MAFAAPESDSSCDDAVAVAQSVTSVCQYDSRSVRLVTIPTQISPRAGFVAAQFVHGVPYAWSSARPTFDVVALTEVTFMRMKEVETWARRGTMVALPSFSRAPKEMLDESEKVRVPLVNWLEAQARQRESREESEMLGGGLNSLMLGRSYSTMLVIV